MNDVSDPEQVQNVIAKVTQTTDRLDTVINNAAIQICNPVVEMNVAEWDRTMAVNLRSTFLFSQLAYPLLKKSRGSMVNVSSVHAIAGFGSSHFLALLSLREGFGWMGEYSSYD